MNEYNFNNLTIHYNFIMMTFIANLNKQVYNVESFPFSFLFFSVGLMSIFAYRHRVNYQLKSHTNISSYIDSGEHS